MRCLYSPFSDNFVLNIRSFCIIPDYIDFIVIKNIHPENFSRVSFCSNSLQSALHIYNVIFIYNRYSI